jgi:DNA-binding beta-propeller fold protein YncE
MKRLGGTAAPAVAAVARFGPAQPCYRLESAVTLKGAASDRSCAAFDPARGYLFIGRGEAAVTVFDVHAQKVICRLDLSADASAVTLVPEFDRGYATHHDGTTTVFRLSTFRSLARIQLGTDADSAFYEPATGQLAFTMAGSRKIVFVDARTARPIGELKMDSAKLDDAVPDGEGRLFVTLRDRNCIAIIDAANRRLDDVWSTADCKEPTALAFDPGAKRLFVGCRGRQPLLAVFDAGSGKLATRLEIGRGNAGVAYDGATHKIYTCNPLDANLVIHDQLDPDNYQLAEVATTRRHVRAMALDPVTRKLYLVAAERAAVREDPLDRCVTTLGPNSTNRGLGDTLAVLTYASSPVLQRSKSSGRSSIGWPCGVRSAA